MNIKGFVIVMVALVGAAALVLFYGALRPASDADDGRGGVEGGLGWLVPSRTLSFDDVRGAACADDETSTLRVAPGTQCRVPVANPSEITLCSNDTTSLSVRTEGEDYPDQRVSAGDLSCAAAVRIPIYDTGTILALRCSGVVVCIVTVGVPPGG